MAQLCPNAQHMRLCCTEAFLTYSTYLIMQHNIAVDNRLREQGAEENIWTSMKEVTGGWNILLETS